LQKVGAERHDKADREREWGRIGHRAQGQDRAKPDGPQAGECRRYRDTDPASNLLNRYHPSVSLGMRNVIIHGWLRRLVRQATSEPT
jgi:hypothetical protein